MQTLSQGLVKLIRGQTIESKDIDKASLLMLDAVANSFAGRNSEAGRKLLDWGHDRPMDAGREAFVMGALAHILEVDDIHRASVVHTGCVTVPVILSLAASHGISGKLLLKSLIFGVEAASRVGMAVGPDHYKVWHNTATCGPYGSAMAAATLLELGNTATMHALGNAGTQSSGFWEFLRTGAMSKHLHAGRAAEAGILAAELAKLDFTGPPEILEGPKGFFSATCLNPNPAAVLQKSDSIWQIHDTSLKPWPSCRHTHPAIDAALRIAGKVDIQNIASVLVKTYWAALDVCDRPIVNSAYGAKFSIQHCVAAALHFGRIEFSSFDDTARRNVSECALKIKIVCDDSYNREYPAAWGAEVTVKNINGQEISATAPLCKGDPEAFLSEEEIIEKAYQLMRFGGIEKPTGIIDQVLGISSGKTAPHPALILSKG